MSFSKTARVSKLTLKDLMPRKENQFDDDRRKNINEYDDYKKWLEDEEIKKRVKYTMAKGYEERLEDELNKLNILIRETYYFFGYNDCLFEQLEFENDILRNLNDININKFEPMRLIKHIKRLQYIYLLQNNKNISNYFFKTTDCDWARVRKTITMDELDNYIENEMDDIINNKSIWSSYYSFCIETVYKLLKEVIITVDGVYHKYFSMSYRDLRLIANAINKIKKTGLVEKKYFVVVEAEEDETDFDADIDEEEFEDF